MFNLDFILDYLVTLANVSMCSTMHDLSTFRAMDNKIAYTGMINSSSVPCAFILFVQYNTDSQRDTNMEN